MKGNSLFSKYILFILGIISLMPRMANSQTFKHFEGIANKKGDYEMIDASTDCLRQKTHVYDYYIAIPSGGSKELSLPFSGYSGDGADLEPRGYFRWYNYDTDKASAQLETYSYSFRSKLKSMKDSRGVDKGLVAYNLSSKPNRKLVGVIYTRPSDTSWTGETIACDVSRYVDGCSGTSFEHEPTLSIRYIFHIMPAEKMANDIKQKLLETGSARDYSYEDGKGVSAGLKDASASMTLRLNQSDVTNYYFHPMNNSYTHHVFAEDEAHQIKETDFTSEVVQATKVQWRVYNSDKTQFVWWTHKGGSYAPRFFDLSLNLLNDAGITAWRNLNGGGVSSKQTFKYGDRIYVVAIALSEDEKKMCPIANFTCQLFNQYPMTTDELKTANQNTRLNSYLDDHYRSVSTVSFDNDDDEQTFLAPTSPDDNQDRLPSKWSRRSYGFVYRELMNSAPAGNMYVNPKHSPLHGDYGLYKSANVKGKSGDGQTGTDGYLWWPSVQLYDRTYANTNGAQYGHFLYIDAADESRQIAEADFSADLCVGSQVIFSAGIADMTTGKQRPQLMFKLYGVNYDENNQETERRLLHSFSSGNFSGNRVGDDDANVGKWYQVYGKMVLQKESGVNSFTDFKLVVDNMCKSTQGADYAFDDLRIYTKASKVDIIQSSPICPDKNTAKDASLSTSILVKLRALQETMAALADNTEKKLYFRFVDADGNPVKSVNYGTAESPNYNWGTTTIYNYVDESQKVDEKPMYEKINDEWNVVLANRYFNLQSNQTYYVSFAFEDEAVEDKNQLSWGKPSDVCSLYSENFQMVQQKVLVTDANGSITTTVTIPCDDNAKPEYNIKAQLQTVDQNNGGSIQLNGVLYNWYVDDAKTPILENSAEFKNIQLGVGEHTIRVIPANASGIINQGGVDYHICLDEMSFKLRVVKNGPQLSLGNVGVAYPNNYTRTVRIGLPQVALLAKQEAKKGKGGYFCVPISGENLVADNSKRLYFVKAGGKDHLDESQYTNVMYLSDTNDPAYQDKIGESLILANLENNYIDRGSKQLKLKFTSQTGNESATSSADSKNVQLHEGYWYEGVLIFREDGSKGTTVLCSGETYIRFAVVPEYATWNPTANNKMSAAWNNDANWRRSVRSELYKNENQYTDYQGGGYVPMKFTKVTIPNLSGLYFPSLGYIAYQKSTGIATKLSNAKGDAATKNIQYDMLAQWDANTESHGLNADGNLECEPFYGNTCDQIYFKPGGELLNQCYLIYNKAWVEKEMKPNTWYALTSPLQDTYAGDIYVPAASGRQESEAFEPITFSSPVNNRVTSPVYQRSWDDKLAEEVTLDGNYSAYDYSGTDISFKNQSLHALSAHWSHIYNKVDRKYLPLEGVAIKMGDKYTVGGAGTSAGSSASSGAASEVLLRLPKADTQYTYVSASQQQSSLSASVDKANAYRLVVNADAQENALGKMSYSLVKLSDGNNYYLVGNPYMATLSMYKFLKANPSLSSSFYVYENGVLKLYNNLDMATTTYESKNDVKISPMQSFFVRLKDGQSASQLNFTSAMTVDREVFGGMKTASDEGQGEDNIALTLTAESASGYRSRSRIVLDASASEDYDDAEDAQLLYDAQLKEVPVVYTVAGDEAVALNSLPNIDWMPLGVVGASSDVESGDAGSSANSASVLLAIDGISRLSSPLYLYDAATRKYQEIKDGEEVKVQANEHGRYFLTQTRSTTGIENAEMGESDVKIYSPARGLIVVSKVSAPLLNKVEVYTLDGRLVASRKAEGAASVSIPVVSTASPQEVYIIKVSMQDTQATITRKLSLR